MVVWVLMACAPTKTDFSDACRTTGDGVCDELSTCPLGSDSTDCNLRCSETPWPSSLFAVCAHDLADPSPDPPLDPVLGTNGSTGEVGTWDGAVTVRGAYSNQEVDRHYRVYVPRRNDPDRPTAETQ